jgi:hypothetical protein
MHETAFDKFKVFVDVAFAARHAPPSPLRDFGSSAPGNAFRKRDAALARTFDPIRRFAQARLHVSRAFKALTRPL